MRIQRRHLPQSQRRTAYMLLSVFLLAAVAFLYQMRSLLAQVANNKLVLDKDQIDESREATAATTSVTAVDTTSTSSYPVTLVTCYFDISGKYAAKKHSTEALQWASKGVLRLETPIVVFTDQPDQVELLAKGRRSPMLLIPTEFEKLPTMRYLPRMKELRSRDWRAKVDKQSSEIYALYFSKPYFVGRAIERNAFNSDIFIWIDIGSIRGWAGINFEDFAGRPWPSPSRLPLIGREGRIMFQGMGGQPYRCNSSYRVDAERPYDPPNPPVQLLSPKDFQQQVVESSYGDGIAGALIAGKAKNWLDFEPVYYSEIEAFLALKMDKYDLIDQHLMNIMACKYPDKIEVIIPPNACCATRINRRWFFMLLYLQSGVYPQSKYTAEELAKKGITPLMSDKNNKMSADEDVDKNASPN